MIRAYYAADKRLTAVFPGGTMSGKAGVYIVTLRREVSGFLPRSVAFVSPAPHQRMVQVDFQKYKRFGRGRQGVFFTH